MARVLVVDDEIGIRQIIRLALERINIAVVEASDPDLALTLVATLPPDLLITDFRLPTMDGLELVRRIREQHPRLPVIFISASIQLSQAAKAAQVGTILEKPFKLTQLQLAVQDLLAPGTPSEALDPPPHSPTHRPE